MKEVDSIISNEKSKNISVSLIAICSDENKKKKRAFKPKKQPRYLIGSEIKSVIQNDLNEYNHHLFKVFTAKCRIDTKPPKYEPNKYLKKPQLCSSLEAYAYIDRQNKILLKKINSINRNKGFLDTFNEKANNNCSRWEIQKDVFEHIHKKNLKFYKKIVNVKTEYAVENCRKFWEGMVESMRCYSKYPDSIQFDEETTESKLRHGPSITVLEKYKTSSYLETINRPKVYLEFKMDGNVNVIGKIIFVLYNDICPRTVENFLTICAGHKKSPLTYKNSLVHKIYTDKYCLMGDITTQNGKGGISIYGNSFEAENFDLKHTRAGVLSMLCFKDNQVNSQFCITFTAMPEFNGKQVVFGKSIQGSEFLRKISNYGHTTGKPLSKIIIFNSGIVKVKKHRRMAIQKVRKNYIQMNRDAVKGKTNQFNINNPKCLPSLY